MSFDAARVHERHLADGTSFDLYVPARPAERLLVSVLPVLEPLVPRRWGVELAGALAEAHGYLVLAPCFDYRSGFQQLGIGGPVRHDLLVLAMLDDVARAYPVATDRLSVFGYSAGGQFAHRFLYLHPERVGQAAIGAPGAVTLPSLDQRWPRGVADLPQVAGTAFALGAVRRPRLLLFVGDQDNDPDDPSLDRTEEARACGHTRLERVRRLHAAWVDAGIPHEYVEIPGAKHADGGLEAVAWAFLAGGSGASAAARFAAARSKPA